MHVSLHSAASEMKSMPKQKQGKKDMEAKVIQLLPSALRDSYI